MIFLCLGAGLATIPACSNAPDLAERPNAAGREDVAASEARRDSAAGLAESLMDRFAANPWAMPETGEPIALGADMFRWDLEERPARDAEDSRGPVLAAEEAGNARRAARLRRVAVRVRLDEPSGGSAAFDNRVPHAVVVRVIDPLAFSNSDAFTEILDKPGGMERLMSLMADLEDEPASEEANP